MVKLRRVISNANESSFNDQWYIATSLAINGQGQELRTQSLLHSHNKKEICLITKSQR